MKERPLYLIENFIDHSLNEAELRELQQLIRKDPDVGNALAEATHLHGLANTVQHEDDSDLTKRVNESIIDLSPNQLEQAVIQAIKKQPNRRNRSILPLWGLAIAAQILIIIALSLISGSGPDDGSVKIATVANCTGSTFVVNGETKKRITAGSALNSGDQVFVEIDSAATIVYTDQSELFLRDRSYIKLVDLDGAKHIHLFAGVLHGDIRKQPKGKPMRVHTEHSRATVLGTQFEINSSNDSDLLEVIEGSVEIEKSDGQEGLEVGQHEYAVAQPAHSIQVKTQGVPLYRSPLITKDSPGQGVDIEVDITGAKKLYLVTTNGGDNNRFDHVVWLNAKLLGSNEYDLREIPWGIAKAGAHNTQLDKGYYDNPIQVEDITYEHGITTHATSVIAYDLPQGCTHFKATAALLDTALAPSNATPSVRFEVYTELPENKLQKLRIRKLHY